MKKIEIASNCTLTLMDTAQFKDVLVAVRFLAPVSRRRVMIRMILSQMLCDRCEKWPTKQTLSDHLDSLYGATATCRTAHYGQLNAFEFRFKCLNDQYTRENTFERLFKTAGEMIFHPLRKEGHLDPELFEEAKRETIMANARKLEQPSSRAIASACAIFGKNHALAETQLLSEEELQSVTLQETEAAMAAMLQQEPVMIFVIGKIDEEKTIRYVQRFLPFTDRLPFPQSVDLIEKKDLEEVSQTMNIDQTSLVLVLRCPVTILSEDYWKMRVANALFGQLPTSLLFSEVREKRSLCYSINSSPLAYEGGILISVGIQKSKLEQTKACILEQLQRMQQGQFSKEDLMTAINMLKNAIYGSYDDPLSTLNFAFQNVLLDRQETVEDCIASIESTTCEDVMRIFKELQHCVTFSLEQEEEHENAY